MPFELDRRAFAAAAASVFIGAGCSKKKSNTQPDSTPGPNGGPTTGGPVSDAKGVSSAKVISSRAKFNCGFPADSLGKTKVHALFVSADSTRALVTNGGIRGNSQVWDVSAAPKRVSEFSGTALAFSPDGSRAIVMSGLGPEVVEAETGKKLGSIRLIANHIYFCAPDSIVGLVRSQDWSKAKNLNVKLFDGATGKDAGSFLAAPDDRVDVAAPVKDGRELILGLPKANSVRVCDLQTKQIVREFQPADPRPTSTNWDGFVASADGKWIAFQKGGDPVNVYDTTSGAVVATLPATLGPFDAAFLPGRSVYAAPSNLAREVKPAARSTLPRMISPRKRSLRLSAGTTYRASRSPFRREAR
jgi:hypothetical protein